MEKIIIYPYDIEFTPVLRHRHLMSSFNIAGLVSPNGWGLSGKDAACADGGSKIGMMVHNSFEELKDLCDSVMLVQPNSSVDCEKLMSSQISKLLLLKKNIICCMDISDRLKEELRQSCEDNGCYFKNWSVGGKNSIKNVKIEEEQLVELNTPVVFILGLGDRTHKFEIQLSLRANFLKEGYKVSQIGSRAYCEYLGFHSFPGFMFDSSLSESNKIVLFNHFVKKIEKTEKPDIILIGIPGGIMPINNKFTNKFGVTAFEASLAIIPDFAVLSTYYEDYKEEYFQMLSKSVKYKLGFGIDCYNLSNNQIDWVNAEQDMCLSYTTIDSGVIDQKRSKFSVLDTPVFNVLNANSSENIFEFMLNKLESYSMAESV